MGGGQIVAGFENVTGQSNAYRAMRHSCPEALDSVIVESGAVTVLLAAVGAIINQPGIAIAFPVSLQEPDLHGRVKAFRDFRRVGLDARRADIPTGFFQATTSPDIAGANLLAA
jgi:hypothetical protein